MVIIIFVFQKVEASTHTGSRDKTDGSPRGPLTGPGAPSLSGSSLGPWTPLPATRDNTTLLSDDKKARGLTKVKFSVK